MMITILGQAYDQRREYRYTWWLDGRLTRNHIATSPDGFIRFGGEETVEPYIHYTSPLFQDFKSAILTDDESTTHLT